MKYRDFEITEGYFGFQYVHDDYDTDNQYLAGDCDTEEDCKLEIDTYYEESDTK